MMMNRANKIQSLFEEIYGTLAIVYHRTKEEGYRNLLSGNPFRVGGGAGELYGPGIYTTYDLKSQLRDRMLVYGDYIVKAKVNLRGFLIFEPGIARRVYPGTIDFSHQLEKVFRVPVEKQKLLFHDEHYLDAINHRFKYEGHSSLQYTSEVAVNMVEKSLGWLRSKTNGLVFHGKRDGKVAVVYDKSSITPISVALSGFGKSNEREIERNFKPVTRTPMNLPKTRFSGGVTQEEAITKRLSSILVKELNKRGITITQGSLNHRDRDSINLIDPMTAPSSASLHLFINITLNREIDFTQRDFTRLLELIFREWKVEVNTFAFDTSSTLDLMFRKYPRGSLKHYRVSAILTPSNMDPGNLYNTAIEFPRQVLNREKYIPRTRNY